MLIGPNPCQTCFGEYGEHADDCPKVNKPSGPVLIERDKIKELVIQMRKYILHHAVPVGDCVAWHKLKLLADVDINDDTDWQKCLAWLEARKTR